MRKLGIAIVVIVLVFVLAVALIPHFLDLSRYHARIQAELEKTIGRPVRFTAIHASFTPPSVRLDEFAIGEDPRFGQGPFAASKQISVSVGLWALLRKNIEIHSMELQSPRLELIADRDGTWNFSTLGQNRQPERHRQHELAKLRISDGQVLVIDQQNNSNATYNHIDLDLRHFAPGKPFDLTASLHLPGKGAEVLTVSGRGGPLPVNGAHGLIPFSGKVSLNQVSLGDLASVTTLPAVQGLAGSVSGLLDVTMDNTAVSSAGSLKLERARIRGVEIGYPLSLDYKVADNPTTGALDIVKGTLHLGNTPLSIAGKVETKAKPMQVDAKVSTSNASIEEAARLAAALGIAFHPGTKIAGKLDADVHAAGAVQQPALNGTIAVRDLAISGGTLKEPVHSPKLELALSPSEIHANPFTAQTGGTTVNAEFTLANYTGHSPDIKATLRTAKASLGELLSIARAYGVSGVEGIGGSGTVMLDVAVAGPMKDVSAMSFNGSGQLANASLSTPSLSQPVYVHSANVRFSQNSMSLENLSASLAGTNTNGSLTIRNFAAPQLQFTLAADKVNVASWQQLTAPPRRKTAQAADFQLVPPVEAAPPASRGALDNVTGSGSLSIGTLTHDQLVLSNVRSQVSLDRGIVKLSPLTSSLYGGQETGTVVLDTRASPMAVTVSSNLQHVDANQLLSSISNLKQKIYGSLAANANARFQAQSAADVVRTLNGTVSFNLTKGRITNTDILGELASVGRFASGSSGERKGYTEVQKLAGTFNITNGVARTNNLNMQIQGATMAAQGTINLVSEALDLHATSVLSRDFSQKVGGVNVGGFMQTALANNKGELVLPVLITGTFQNPHFAPDVEQMAHLKMQNMLPSFNNPGQLTVGALGSMLGGKPALNAPRGLGNMLGLPNQEPPQTGKQQQQKQQKQQNPLDNALKGIFGGKKKE